MNDANHSSPGAAAPPRLSLATRRGRRVPIPSAIFALLTCTVSLLVAQDYSSDKPPPVPEISIPLTAEEQAALRAVDVRIAGVEALIAKIDDPAYKASVISAVEDLKRRRAALAKKFDPGLYEALMHAVISRYQVVALWLTPPRLPPPAAKTPATSAATATPKGRPPPEKKSEARPGS
jgi:hypothetical protein